MCVLFIVYGFRLGVGKVVEKFRYGDKKWKVFYFIFGLLGREFFAGIYIGVLW